MAFIENYLGNQKGIYYVSKRYPDTENKNYSKQDIEWYYLMLFCYFNDSKWIM